MSESRPAIDALPEAAIPSAGEMLGRAFFDDPLWTWVLPDDERRRSALGPFLSIGVRYGHAFGTVHAAAGAAQGCAVWLPPGDSAFAPERGAGLGAAEMPALLGGEGFGRFLAAMEHLGALHRELAPDDHWYLMILGVDPPHQRHGVGRALLEPVLSRADRKGRRCYLETQKARNVPFYQAQGFAVVRETDVPSGPHLWLMARPPRPR